MGMRYVVSALIGAFCLFAIFAAIKTVRHLSQRQGSTGAIRTKQSRQAEYDRLTALPRGSGWSLRTSEPTAQLFVPSVRWPTRGPDKKTA
jgi:hypothetical protein